MPRSTSFLDYNALNIGCGENPIETAWNVDVISSKMDEQFNVAEPLFILPWKEHFDKIYFFHTIEHIVEPAHPIVFAHLHHYLKMGGKAYISYPEFKVCAEYYATNFRGQRDFWKACIYGLQRHAADFHVTLMDTEILIQRLPAYGFKLINRAQEPNQPQYTIICIEKVARPNTRDEVMRKEYSPRVKDSHNA